MNIHEFVDVLVKRGMDFEGLLQRLENVEMVIAPLLGSVGAEALAATGAAAEVTGAVVEAAKAIEPAPAAPVAPPAPVVVPKPAAPAASDVIANFAKLFMAKA